MTKHTATPWRAVIYGNSEWEVWGGDLLVADVTTPEDPLQPEVAYANAAFIVRAANSHAALVAALRAVEWGGAAGGGGEACCPSCYGWPVAHAANPFDPDSRAEPAGHTPDCQLHAALRAAEGE